MSIKKDLLKKTKEYADYAKEHAKDYADQAKDYATDKAKEFASSAKDQAQDYAGVAKNKGEDYAKYYAGIAKDKGKDYAKYAKKYAKQQAKDYAAQAKTYAKDKSCGSSAASIAVALIGGIVIGAALGILFAPEAGTETRSNLGDQLQDFGSTVADKAQQGKEAIVNAVDAVKSKISGEEDDQDIDHPSFS